MLKPTRAKRSIRPIRTIRPRLSPVPIAHSDEHEVSVLLAFAVFAIACLAYLNSLHGAFVFDDITIVQNAASWRPSLSGVLFNWRGLLDLTYYLNYHTSGLDTFGYHLVNVLLHAVNCVLVFALLLHASRLNTPAFSGAALFAVHPLLTSATASISGRSSLLCATFYFAAILFVFRSEDEAYEPDRVRYGKLFALVCGLLAWNVKQEAIALPIFLFVWIALSGRLSLRWALGLSLPPALVLFFLRDDILNLLHITSTNTRLTAAGFGDVLAQPQYLYTYVTSVSGYLLPRFFIPIWLSVDPHVGTVTSWMNPAFLISAALVLILTYVIWQTRTLEPLLSIGLAAILFSPLLPYAFTPLADPVFEHRAYIPMLGTAFLFAYVIQYLRLHPIVLIAPIFIFFCMTFERNYVWRTELSFWSSAVQSSPLKPRPHLNLGSVYQRQGPAYWPEALQHLQHAVRLNPGLHAAYSNIASIQIDSNDLAAAQTTLNRLTTIAPEYVDAWINLAVLTMRQGRPYDALEYLDHALTLSPDYPPAVINRNEALRYIAKLEGGL